MGRKPDQRTDADFIEYLRSGRDEMNLLEHSISSAGKDVDRNTRSLVFNRDDVDPETGEEVIRSWKVTFSAEYGRPNHRDDDVFVGLMKLSADTNFQSPRIEFTSYELCRVLRWDICGKSYKAIDDAFNRMAGVLVVAKNYWYDNKAKLWADRKFGIIDDVFLYERGKRDRARKAAGGLAPKSWFRWSDVMQESFDAGYLKKLDIDTYLSLTNPVSRKLYRYLGKHFWNRSKHAIDLEELCHEKLGYSESEKRVARLRQKLGPAIKELEAKGIYGLSHEFKASYGKCEVVFVSSKKDFAKPKTQTHPLIQRLIALGIEKGHAAEAVKQHAEERIVEDIEAVEYQAKKGEIKKSKHGLLASMLKAPEPWQRPVGFVSSRQRDDAARRTAELRNREAKLKADETARQQAEDVEERIAFDEFMQNLESDAARNAFEEEAISKNTLCRGFYKQAKDAGDREKMKFYLDTATRLHWKDVCKSAAS